VLIKSSVRTTAKTIINCCGHMYRIIMDGRRSLSDSGVGSDSSSSDSISRGSSLISISQGESSSGNQMGSIGDSMTECELGNGSCSSHSASSFSSYFTGQFNSWRNNNNSTNAININKNISIIPTLAPLIRITVEPVSSEEDSDADSSIFLELSETGLSDKTLAELDGIIEDSGIMVSCDEVEDSFSGDNELQIDVVGESELINDPSLVEDSLSSSPNSKSKLGFFGRRTRSSPSHTNLSEEASSSNEEGDGGSSGGGGGGGGGSALVDGDATSLKVEEIKPRRRNTLADIFRWYAVSKYK
jgi:hypothetical protein